MNVTPWDESDVGDRSYEFHATADVLSEFESDLEGLIGRVEPDEKIDIPGLMHVVRCLTLIFDSKAAEASYALAPPKLRAQLWLTESFLKSVASQLSTARARLENLTNLDAVNYNVAELQDQLHALLRRSELGVVDYLPKETQELLRKVIDGIVDEVEAHKRRKSLMELEGRAEAAVTKTEAAAEIAAKAAGKTGDDAMSSFYDKLATSESASADKFRKLTVGFALAGGTFALLFVLLPEGFFPAVHASTSDYARLVQKAVFIAGVFGIAGYFARQAHQHRSMANWAKTLAVQLQTFDAYLGGITDEAVADDLRKSFATRVFGDHPAMKGEPTVTPSAAAMDTAVGWAAKLTAGGAK